MFPKWSKRGSPLAAKIDNRLLTKGEPPLTILERAYAHSFCQGMSTLTVVSNRLGGLLAEDYNLRFSKVKENTNTPPKDVPGTPKPTKEKKEPNKKNTPPPQKGQRKPKK